MLRLIVFSGLKSFLGRKKKSGTIINKRKSIAVLREDKEYSEYNRNRLIVPQITNE